MSKLQYKCEICATDLKQKSHHTKHLLTEKHTDKKKIKLNELDQLSKDELIAEYNNNNVNEIINFMETREYDVINNNAIPCKTLCTTNKYQYSYNILWKLSDNIDTNINNSTINNSLKAIIKSCHDKLYSSSSIVGIKAQNDIMRILCIKLLQDQFNDESSELYQRCLKQNENLSENKYKQYLSYCKDLNNLIKNDDVFKEWKFLVNRYLKEILPSIYFEQDNKFNCENMNCIIDIIKIINTLKIDANFKDSFATACGDIHESFRAYSGGKGAKELGQYFTPRQLIHLMFHALGIDDLLQSQTDIYDPCMGTGGFLTRMFNMATIDSKNIYGCETELDTIKFGYMSLYLTTNECKHNIYKCNSLCENPLIQNNKMGGIITNPPFGTKMNYKDLEKTYNTKYPNSDITFMDIYPIKVNNGACLFIQHCVFMLKQNGFCAIVLPDGELFEGSSKWSKTFRKWWCNSVNIRTILKVASGTFEHAGVKTNIVIFTNDGPTENIKFMETSKECNEVKELFTITMNDLQSTEYSLDIGEYLEEVNQNYNCPMVALGDVCEFLPKSKRLASYGIKNGKYAFYTSSQKCTKYCNEYDYEEQCIIIGTGGTANIKYDKQFSCSSHNTVIQCINNLNIKYLYNYLLFNIQILNNGFKGSGIKNISIDYIKKLKIPLPSPEIQQEIITELTIVENSIKTIETRLTQLKIEKEQYKKYARKADIRGLLGDCPMVELKQLFNIKYGDKNPSTKCIGQQYPNISGGSKVSKYTDEWNIKENTILIARSGSCGSVNMFNEKCLMGSYGFCLDPLTDDLNIKYIYYTLTFNQSSIEKLSRGTAVKNINRDKLYSFKIPHPSPEIQQECIQIFEEKEQYLNKMDEKINQEKQYMDELKTLGKDIISSFC